MSINLDNYYNLESAKLEGIIPSAVFCSDVHWRETVPICRTDNFISALENKMDFIKRLCTEYGTPLMIAGDFFHKATPTLRVIAMSAKHLPQEVIIIPGQHDLIGHNIDTFENTGLGLLSNFEHVQADKIPFESGCDYEFQTTKGKRIVTLLHRFVYPYNAPWKGCEGTSTVKLFEEFPKSDIIVVGDNHKPFIIEQEGRIVLNCGSIMRTTTDQKKHKPACYAWYAQENRIIPLYLPIEKDVIDDTHIKEKEWKDEQMEAFVSGMKTSTESFDLDFKKNAKTIIRDSKIDSAVEDRFWEIVNEAERG